MKKTLLKYVVNSTLLIAQSVLSGRSKFLVAQKKIANSFKLKISDRSNEQKKNNPPCFSLKVKKG